MNRPVVTQFHLLLLMVMVAITVTAFFKTPVDYQMVLHWDVHGTADWALPRGEGFIILPIIAAIAVAGFWLGGMVPRKAALEMGRHVLEPALMWFLLMLDALQFGLLLTGFGSDLDFIRILAGGLAVGILLVGIFLREADRHSYAGLRMPWQIRNDTVFRWTHRIAGWLYVLAGLTVALLVWLQPFPGLLIAALVGGSVLPVLTGVLFSLLGTALTHRAEQQRATD